MYDLFEYKWTKILQKCYSVTCFHFFCEKQENCKAISGHFHYVNHKYTSSRRKHIWHLENIRNTITSDENSQREYFDRLKNQNLRKNIPFLRLQKCSIDFLFDDKCFFLNTKFFTIIACPLPFFHQIKATSFIFST